MISVSLPQSFSLEKIAHSGQTFRVSLTPTGGAQFVHQGLGLVLEPDGEASLGAQRFCVHTDEKTWRRVWKPYLGLTMSYDRLAREARAEFDDAFLRRALRWGRGLRVLHQDPWETLFTFIVSQRKSIPAIREVVYQVSRRYGRVILDAQGAPFRTPSGEPLYAFPEPDALRAVTLEALLALKVGYRAPYLLAAIRRLNEEPMFLRALTGRPSAEILDALQTLDGVGIKVASCVALYAYRCFDVAPIDVWMQRIMDTVYGGHVPAWMSHPHAGIFQQFVFDYAVNHKAAFPKGTPA